MGVFINIKNDFEYFFFISSKRPSAVTRWLRKINQETFFIHLIRNLNYLRKRVRSVFPYEFPPS